MIVVPAWVKVVGEADFTTVSAGDAAAVAVAVDAAEVVTAVVPGAVPRAVALLVTWPASTSACVVLYVAVQVV